MSTEMLEQKLAEFERRLAAVEELSTTVSTKSLKLIPADPTTTGATAVSMPGFEMAVKSGAFSETELPIRRKPHASWEKIFGCATNDTLVREAADLGAEWRKQMNGGCEPAE